MPDMDGFTLVEQLREDPRWRHLPVVLLTATTVQNEFEQCERLHVTAQVTKPIKQSDLLDAVTRAVGSSRRQQVSERPADEPITSSSLPHLRILLAEDSLMNQKLVLGLLQNDHDVTVVGDGQQALDRLSQQTFDLVLMDVQMPELDGLEATRQVRARERVSGGHTPIIAMTAHAMKGDRERCLAAGMDHYLSKPIRAARLFEALAFTLEHQTEAPGSWSGVTFFDESARSSTGTRRCTASTETSGCCARSSKRFWTSRRDCWPPSAEPLNRGTPPRCNALPTR